MREYEFSQPTYGKSPVLIYQCLCTQIPKDSQHSPSKIKNFLSLKEWLFPKNKRIQPATLNLSNSKNNNL
ncbi:MAG: hypothetical protein CVU41_03450 [Chloroflexi bacterium HGW-Chloroflexi-3]|nr:MAG: hypothetical protein CVU41_03450 [Chloroflexi bacterium HGW-Chloroflexi-3]